MTVMLAPKKSAAAIRSMGLKADYVEVPGFTLYRSGGLLWFRVFGYGLSITSLTSRSMTFGCREGVCRDWHIGRHAVEVLKP